MTVTKPPKADRAPESLTATEPTPDPSGLIRPVNPFALALRCAEECGATYRIVWERTPHGRLASKGPRGSRMHWCRVYTVWQLRARTELSYPELSVLFGGRSGSYSTLIDLHRMAETDERFRKPFPTSETKARNEA